MVGTPVDVKVVDGSARTCHGGVEECAFLSTLVGTESRMHAWAKLGLAVLAAGATLPAIPAGPAAADGGPRVPRLARQVLAANDGWASAGPGTTGGSAADDAHVFVVHTRD